MAYSQTDIDTLKAAIATGAVEVEFGTGAERRRVKYRDLDQMKQILADMQAEVAGVTVPAVTYAEHCRD